MKKIDLSAAKRLARAALAEDKGEGDITSSLLLSRTKISAELISREKGIVAGLEVARLVFRLASPKIKFQAKLKDGDSLAHGKVVARISGPGQPILTAERVALNFLGRLSGIATLTRQFVRQAMPYPVKIFDTRKTTPLLRRLEKYAVRAGGGYNHRMTLGEQVLIKDNHIKACQKTSSLVSLVSSARKKAGRRIKVEIEVENLAQLRAVLSARPDIIMLDNMKVAEVRKAVVLRNRLKGRRPLLEASGGIALANVRRFARTGVDLISVGALTHSAPSLDFSLEVNEAPD